LSKAEISAIYLMQSNILLLSKKEKFISFQINLFSIVQKQKENDFVLLISTKKRER
jgi:hypothetical protein